MNKILKWLENYWFYHKWHTLCVAIIAASFILAVAQCASRETYDYNILVFTYTEFSEEQKEKMSSYISKFGEDTDGDGTVTVGFVDCSYDKASTPMQLTESKISRLQSTLIAEPEIVLFLTDSSSFKYLDSIFDGAIFADSGLSADDGKSVIFGNEFYESTVVNENYYLPDGLRLSRRAKSDTITHSEDVISSAVKLLENLNNYQIS